MLWMPRQLQLQYETDTTTKRGKAANFKTKNTKFSIFCMKIFFIENGENLLFLGKLGTSKLPAFFYLSIL